MPRRLHPPPQQRRRHKRKRSTTLNTPSQTFLGPHQYPTSRTPANQRYHFIETEVPVETSYQCPNRPRLARLTSEQIRQAVADKNVDLLNAVATQSKLLEFTYIAVDSDGKGLCLKASQFIAQQHPQRIRVDYVSKTERNAP
jgi:hypothetical protein